MASTSGVRCRAGGDRAMTTGSMRVEDDAKLFLGEAWSDPIEAGIRDRIRGFIEQLIEEELAVALGRGRYERRHWRGDGMLPRSARPIRTRGSPSAAASAPAGGGAACSAEVAGPSPEGTGRGAPAWKPRGDVGTDRGCRTGGVCGRGEVPDIAAAPGRRTR